jgi:site-specific recombinase XerD
MTVLRQFFRFARSRKIILADPTRDLAAREPRGFTGQTLAHDRQREMFRRSATGRDAHPHEALLGVLALLHGASGHEVRHLRTSDIDETQEPPLIPAVHSPGHRATPRASG